VECSPVKEIIREIENFKISGKALSIAKKEKTKKGKLVKRNACNCPAVVIAAESDITASNAPLTNVIAISRRSMSDCNFPRVYTGSLTDHFVFLLQSRSEIARLDFHSLSWDITARESERKVLKVL